MNRLLIPLLFVALTTNYCIAQTWPRTYYTPELSQHFLAFDFTNTFGGIFVSSKWDHAAKLSMSDYYLVRLAPNGDTLWAKKNCLDGPYHPMINTIRQTSRGEYLVASAINDPAVLDNTPIGTRFYRIDSNGNIVHQITRKADRTQEYYVNMEPADNNGYYISYSYDSFFVCCAGQGSRYASTSVIEKFDSNNVRIWQKRTTNDFCYVLTWDLMCGQEWSNAYDFCILHTARTIDNGLFYINRGKVGKLNADGTTAFEHDISTDFPGYHMAYYAFPTSDTGLVISLFDTVQHLCKYNSAGVMTHNVPVSTRLSYYESGVEITDGKYIVAGGHNFRTSAGLYLLDADLNKIDSIVKPFWDTSFTHAPIVRSGDGEAMYMRLATSAPAVYDYKVFAAKVDTLLNVHRHLKTTMSSNCLVPGYVSHLDIALHNMGSMIVDTTITVVVDSNTYYLSSSLAPAAIAGDTLIFTIDSLLADSTLNITVNVLVDSTIGLGALLTFRANSDYQNNIMPGDDSVVYSNATVSSFDPNFKSVNKSFYFLPDSRKLIYMIGYENTGNFMARNIKILDTIDRHLDRATIRVLNAERQIPDVITQEGNAVIFNLPNVNLPDSASDPLGYHAVFTYEIEMKDDVALGDTIVNTAHIIFDYNDPVVTNTTMNIISDRNGPYEYLVPTVPAVVVYPNPSDGKITLTLPKGVWDIVMSDLLGRVVVSGRGNAPQAEIVTSANNGTYMLKATNRVTGQIVVKKVIIQK